MTDLKQQARGRWRGILTSAGIDASHLTGRHCGCPACRAGKDRFRFDDKGGDGTWFCNQCLSGDGFSLLMKAKGIEFKQACELVRQHLGVCEPDQPRRELGDEAKRDIARTVWRSAGRIQPGDLADRYLTSRHLPQRPGCLRYTDRCRYDKHGFHPAMLAQVSDAAGVVVTVHRTYLGEHGKADVETPRKLMPGPVPPGSAVRLGPVAGAMGVAEGIETALAASQLFGLPVWAALTAGLLEKWEPPQECREIVILGDNDSHKQFRGEQAAYTLANRLAAKGMAVRVKVPRLPGTDWCDVLKAQRELNATEERELA